MRFASTRTLGILTMICLAFSSRAGNGQTKTVSADNVHLTLTRQTIWQGAYGWCTFIVEVLPDRAGMSQHCGRGGPVIVPPPSSERIRHRLLTKVETATIRRLYDAAGLFDGGHIGADLSYSDLPFELLIVRPVPSGGPAAALVTTGNATFDSGPRKALVDWMRQQEQELRRMSPSKK